MVNRKINVPGAGDVDAIQVGFRPTQEYWSEYHLDDGSAVRVKLVVTSIFRLKDQFDTEGNPAYLVNSTNVMAVDAEEDQRRPGS